MILLQLLQANTFMGLTAALKGLRRKENPFYLITVRFSKPISCTLSA